MDSSPLVTQGDRPNMKYSELKKALHKNKAERQMYKSAWESTIASKDKALLEISRLKFKVAILEEVKTSGTLQREVERLKTENRHLQRMINTRKH
jgi:Na+-transporting NADH:ubiquinone oxidoreductase subunit NqrF